MKIFNLYGDEWDETRDREGWLIKEAFECYAATRHSGRPKVSKP